jgi:hypothetical protein
MAEARRTLTDLQILIARALRLSLRNVDGLITALMLPPMLMFMFVYFFGGATHTGGHYVDFVVPGVLLVCVGFGSGTTAVSVATDLSGAIVDRLRSMNVRGDRAADPVRARDLVVRRRNRDPHEIARGSAGDHVHRQLPALPLQRVRAGLDDASVAARIRGQPAGQPGRRRGPGVAGGRLGGGRARFNGVALDRLEHWNPGRFLGLAGTLLRRRTG